MSKVYFNKSEEYEEILNYMRTYIPENMLEESEDYDLVTPILNSVIAEDADHLYDLINDNRKLFGFDNSHEFDMIYDTAEDILVKVVQQNNIKVADSISTYDEGSERIDIVIQVKDKFFKTTYFYTSYSGLDDEFFEMSDLMHEVKPHVVEKVIYK